MCEIVNACVFLRKRHELCFVFPLQKCIPFSSEFIQSLEHPRILSKYYPMPFYSYPHSPSVALLKNTGFPPLGLAPCPAVTVWRQKSRRKKDLEQTSMFCGTWNFCILISQCVRPKIYMFSSKFKVTTIKSIWLK